MKAHRNDRPARGERGQTIAIVAILMPVLIGMTGLVLDVGMWYVNRQQAQNAADFAALAAAAKLPDSPQQAEASAQSEATTNLPGAATSVTTPYNSDDTTVAVRVSDNAPTYFSKIFGLKSVAVSARAVARAAPKKVPTALFSYDSSCGGSSGVSTNGNNMNIGGGIVSNGGFHVNGNNNVASSAQSGGPNNCKPLVNGNNNGFPTSPTPDISNSITDWPQYYDQSSLPCTYNYANYTQNGNNVTLPSGVYCVSGRFLLNGNHLSGNITVIANSFIVNGNNYTFKPYTQGLLFFQTGSGIMTQNGNSYDWNGTLFAPNGTIQINGNSFTAYTGMVEAYDVRANGNNFHMLGTGRAVSQGKPQLIE